MARTAKKVRRGRPPLPPEEKRLPSMGFRPSLTLRKALEDAISVSGRSLSQEIESRLEQTFLRDEVKFDDFGGKEKYALARLFAVSANLLEPRLRDMVKELQASGRLPKAAADKLKQQTWANNWVFFQFATALWLRTAKQARFEVPQGLEAFESALRGSEESGVGIENLNELGVVISEWMTAETKDPKSTK